METNNIRMKTLEDFILEGRTVILRPDINSPIDAKTKKIVNTNRLEKGAPTLKALLKAGAKRVITTNPTDTFDAKQKKRKIR